MTVNSAGTVNIRANGRGDGNDTEDDENTLSENHHQMEMADMAGMDMNDVFKNLEIKWLLYDWLSLREFFK